MPKILLLWVTRIRTLSCRISTTFVAVVCAFVAASLAGCADPVGNAEKKLAIVEAQRGVTSREVCAAKRDVASAYLTANDAKGYADAKLFADSACLNAELDERFYGAGAPYRDAERIEPDNMEAKVE